MVNCFRQRAAQSVQVNPRPYGALGSEDGVPELPRARDLRTVPGRAPMYNDIVLCCGLGDTAKD